MTKFFGNKTAIFLFTFPLLALYTIFVVYPIIPGIITSLQNHNGFSSQGFAGLANYKDVVQTPEFWKSNLNNLIIIAVSTLLGLPFSLFLAMLIDVQTSGMRRFFKIASFMPAVLSVTVISQMWIAIYEPRWGLLNTILQNIGLESLTGQWLSDEKTAIFSITVAFLWQFIGFNMLLFYTGIKSIPKTYYEAALIDGANYMQSCVKITVPLLQEVTKYLLLISILGSMAQFAHVRIMTNGGPGDASRTIVYQLYYTAFMQSDYGKGSAIAVLFIIESLIITLIINSIVAKKKLQF